MSQPQYKDIAELLRQEIVSDALVAGDRLPVNRELMERFQASPLTISRAMKCLAEDGFIVSRGAAGTYVTDRPPHRHRFGFVFPQWHSEAIDMSWFPYRIVQCALDMNHEDDIDFVFYDLVDKELSAETQQRLLDDLSHHRLAGVFLAFAMLDIEALLAEHATISAVCLGRTEKSNLPQVYPDEYAFIQEALQTVKARGCQTPAVIARHYPDAHFLELDRISKEVQLPVPEHHVLCFEPGFPRGIINAVQLLMKSSDRPDSLIITNDLLANPVLTGLLKCGLNLPGDLEVICHCNFPVHTPPILPVDLLGFSPREVIETALDMLRALADGQTLPRFTGVQPHFG